MVFRLNYQAHEALVRSARKKPDLWRLFLGLVGIVFVSYALIFLWHSFWLGFFSDEWLPVLIEGSTPAAMLILLFGFVFVTVGVALIASILHKRSLIEITGPLRPLFWQFQRVLLSLLVLGGVLLVLPPYEIGEVGLVSNLPFSRWIGLLPISLLALLVQVSAEEILFRGYIQQSLAAKFRNPLIWVLFPSVLFALGHYLPAEAGDNALLLVIWSGLFGLFMADLTARAGTLGPAIAVHFFNNFVALLLISTPTNLYGLSLYVMPFELSDTEALRPWLAVDCLMMLVTWLVARLAIRR